MLPRRCCALRKWRRVINTVPTYPCSELNPVFPTPTELLVRKESFINELFTDLFIYLLIYSIIRIFRDPLRAGRSRDQIPVGTRFSTLVQTQPVAHPTSYTLGTGSSLGLKRPGRGVNHPPHLALRLKKEYSYTTIGCGLVK
jgi:hypothetical protein